MTLSHAVTYKTENYTEQALPKRTKMPVNMETSMNVFFVILVILGIGVPIMAVVSAYMYRQTTRQELEDMRVKLIRLESDHLQMQTQYKILFIEHQELMKQYINNSK